MTKKQFTISLSLSLSLSFSISRYIYIYIYSIYVPQYKVKVFHKVYLYEANLKDYKFSRSGSNTCTVSSSFPFRVATVTENKPSPYLF